MAFAQYKQSDFVTYHDLAKPDGNAATIINAKLEMKEDYRTKQEVQKLVIYFTDFKPLVLTNKNLEALDMCFPNDDANTLAGKQIWLRPVDIEVAGDPKQIVRIDTSLTLRLQPAPGPGNAQPPTPGATPSDVPPTPPPIGDEPPPPTDADRQFSEGLDETPPF